MISLVSASLVYDDRGRSVHACRDISVTISDGEFLGILGPSGSGKSSLLYLMSGLKVPTHGSAILDGQDLHSLSDQKRADIRLNHFGFIFQHPFLVGYLTAVENVCIAYPGQKRFDEAMSLLEEVELADLAYRFPHELSGGQRQRICVARALLGSPKVIFADEPTASLDHTSGLQVMQTLNRHRGSGALVVVTHDPSMLEETDRVIRIEDGEIVD